MIVKIKTVDNAWVYYQIQRKVKVRNLTDQQYKNGRKLKTDDRNEVIEDWDNLPGHMIGLNGYRGQLIVINFEDKEKTDSESIIYTNLSVYLLNDDGKTIEKLN